MCTEIVESLGVWILNWHFSSNIMKTIGTRKRWGNQDVLVEYAAHIVDVPTPTQRLQITKEK